MKATLMFPLVGAALAELTASMAKNNNPITDKYLALTFSKLIAWILNFSLTQSLEGLRLCCLLTHAKS